MTAIVALLLLLFATPAWAATYVLNWADTASGETEWQIERKVEGGSYAALATTGGDVVYYSDSSAGASSYRYRVRSLVGGVAGPYSNEACVPTACGAAPGFPKPSGGLADEPLRLVAGVLGQATSNGKVYFAASCSQANVNTALGSAGVETVVVPPGACTWSGTSTLTKFTRLRGSGINSSNGSRIAATGGPSIEIDPSSCTGGGPEVEVTGFAFNTNNTGSVIRLRADHNASKNPLCTQANIHHNTFAGITTANSGRRYVASYGMGGVIWKNTLSGAWQVFVGLGNGTVGSGVDFDGYDVALNTAKAVYFEDNILTKTETSDNYVMDNQFGALRVVWRYNTWNIPNSAGGLQTAIDWHGYNSGGYTSSQGHVLYGNNFVFTNNGSVYDGLVNARGGRGLMYFNNVTSSTGMSPANFDGSYGCATDYTDHQWTRQYHWNNRRNSTTALSGSTNDGYSTCDGGNYPSEGRQYFDHNTATMSPGYNLTAGVGCGTLANRPTTCTARVGYWATSGSCASVSGYTGDIVSNPTRANIPTGTLYVCGAGNTWSEWYTPYSYPHPLRQGN